MKNKITIALLLIGTVLAYGQGVDILEPVLAMKYKIKTQALYEYDYVKGKREEKGALARIDSFDLKGNRVQQINFRMNRIHSVVTYNFDDNGNKLEYAKYTGDEKKLNYKQDIKWDTRGNKQMEMGYNGVDNFRVVYTYNKQNKLTEVTYYKDKSVDEKRIINYDGNNSEIKVYNSQNQIIFTLKNKYSATNKLLEEQKLETNGNVSRKITYIYDKNDNCISETKYIGEKLSSTIKKVYNDKGLLIEIHQENPEVPMFIINKYAYNDKGQLVDDQSRNDPNKDFSKNSYSYDEKGICKTIDSYYAAYKQQVLSVFTYTFY